MSNNRTVKDWIIATRPWSFPASAMPVLVTMLFLFSKGLSINWLNGIIALITIVIIQAAGNLWGDYFDYKYKVDDKDTFGSTLLTSGLFTMKEVITYATVLNVIAVALGVYMVCVTGLPMLWLGIFGILLSLFYPFLKYNALGDVVIALCYGVLPSLGTSYILCGEFYADVFFVAVPLMLIIIAILHANNTRDIETDSRVNIQTFAIKTGRKVASAVYVAEMTIPFALILAFSLCGVISYWTNLVFLSLPLVIKNIQQLFSYRKEGRKPLANLDAKTAMFLLPFSALLIIGLLV